MIAEYILAIIPTGSTDMAILGSAHFGMLNKKSAFKPKEEEEDRHLGAFFFFSSLPRSRKEWMPRDAA